MASSWRKVGNVVTSCGHPKSHPYPYRLEKVKFGVPLDEVCKNDELLPGPLLVLILKLNKEAPLRKDVFRAPGHQASIKKLIHFLQAGRLVNVDNYSVYTIASVLKKFLRKIPNGIFGRDGEAELFAIIDITDENEQQRRTHRLITSLPIYTQRLLVLLFGTFRIIASNAERCSTGMTSEALGVSVAPSFLQSCVSDGKIARMEDVLRFKVATRIMKKIIDQFATYDLFGRDNYEFYARVTGRILKVQDEWICNFFRFPPPPRGKIAQQKFALKLSLEAEKTWLQCECQRWGLIQEESQSTPALLTTSSSTALDNSDHSIDIIPELSLLESCQRLSVSLEGPAVFGLSSDNIQSAGDTKLLSPTADATKSAFAALSTTNNTESDKRSSFSSNGALQRNDSNNGIKHSSSCSSTKSSKSASAIASGSTSNNHMTMDELRAVNRFAESTKSLSYLPQFHMNSTSMQSSVIQNSNSNQHIHNTKQLSIVSSTPYSLNSSSYMKLPSCTHLSSPSQLSNNHNHSTIIKSVKYSSTDNKKNNEEKTEKNSSIDPIEKVHERQTARMRTRSEWFLEPGPHIIGGGGGGEGPSSLDLSDYQFFGGSTNDIQDHHNQLMNNAMMLMLHNSAAVHQHNHQQNQQQHQNNNHQQMDISGDELDNNDIAPQSSNISHMNYLGTTTANQYTNFPSISGSYEIVNNNNINNINNNNNNNNNFNASSLHSVNNASCCNYVNYHHQHNHNYRQNPINNTEFLLNSNHYNDIGIPLISRIENNHGDGPQIIIIHSPSPQQQQQQHQHQQSLHNNVTDSEFSSINQLDLLSSNSSQSFHSNQSYGGGSLNSSILINGDNLDGNNDRANGGNISNTINNDNFSIDNTSTNTIRSEEVVDYIITANSEYARRSHRRNRNSVARNRLLNELNNDNSERNSNVLSMFFTVLDFLF